ncbi:hypothetical protein VPH35_099413 [Triticum aestivum]|uniref:KIB1-4 beta-propeller domain-containing protein n=1 Tax=Aegilops tauschii TaxID=37682 RepID=M8BM23_AEGTA
MLLSHALNCDSGRCLLLHADTGRFLWMNVLRLRGYVYITSTEDGLLVLQETFGLNMMAVLNPFTGHLVRFSKKPPYCLGAQLVAACSSPMLFYIFYPFHGICVDPTSDLDWMLEFSAYPDLDGFGSVVAFQGRAYAVDDKGTVVVVKGQRQDDESETISTVIAGSWEEEILPTFLVDNAGELLLVRFLSSHGGLQVFRVDIENRILKAIKYTGNLPAIEGNCVYYVDRVPRPQNGGICMHRLVDGSDEKLFFEPVERLTRFLPLSLAQVLVGYP